MTCIYSQTVKEKKRVKSKQKTNSSDAALVNSFFTGFNFTKGIINYYQ